jgi:hypothetical protein
MEGLINLGSRILESLSSLIISIYGETKRDSFLTETMSLSLTLLFKPFSLGDYDEGV